MSTQQGPTATQQRAPSSAPLKHPPTAQQRAPGSGAPAGPELGPQAEESPAPTKGSAGQGPEGTAQRPATGPPYHGAPSQPSTAQDVVTGGAQPGGGARSQLQSGGAASERGAAAQYAGAAGQHAATSAVEAGKAGAVAAGDSARGVAGLGKAATGASATGVAGTAGGAGKEAAGASAEGAKGAGGAAAGAGGKAVKEGKGAAGAAGRAAKGAAGTAAETGGAVAGGAQEGAKSVGERVKEGAKTAAGTAASVAGSAARAVETARGAVAIGKGAAHTAQATAEGAASAVKSVGEGVEGAAKGVVGAGEDVVEGVEGAVGAAWSVMEGAGSWAAWGGEQATLAVQPLVSGLWWLSVTLPWEVTAAGARMGGRAASAAATGVLGSGRWLALNSTQAINSSADVAYHLMLGALRTVNNTMDHLVTTTPPLIRDTLAAAHARKGGRAHLSLDALRKEAAEGKAGVAGGEEGDADAPLIGPAGDVAAAANAALHRVFDKARSEDGGGEAGSTLLAEARLLVWHAWMLVALQVTAVRTMLKVMEGCVGWAASAWVQLATAAAILTAMALSAPAAAAAFALAWACHFGLQQALVVRGYGGTVLGLLAPPLHSGIVTLRSVVAPYLEVSEEEEEEEGSSSSGEEGEEEAEGGMERGMAASLLSWPLRTLRPARALLAGWLARGEELSARLLPHGESAESAREGSARGDDELVRAEGVARDAAAKASSLATATLWTVVDVGRVAAVGVAQRLALPLPPWLLASGSPAMRAAAGELSVHDFNTSAGSGPASGHEALGGSREEVGKEAGEAAAAGGGQGGGSAGEGTGNTAAPGKEGEQADVQGAGKAGGAEVKEGAKGAGKEPAAAKEAASGKEGMKEAGREGGQAPAPKGAEQPAGGKQQGGERKEEEEEQLGGSIVGSVKQATKGLAAMAVAKPIDIAADLAKKAIDKTAEAAKQVVAGEMVENGNKRAA